MTKEEAQKEIQRLVAAAYESITKAEKLAEEHKTSFGFSLAYGMGGTFHGDVDNRPGEDCEDGWCASSRGC